MYKYIPLITDVFLTEFVKFILVLILLLCSVLLLTLVSDIYAVHKETQQLDILE